MRTVRYVRCDVFSDRIFGGNPLAVFTDGRALDTATMQRIAAEMNLSETVFLVPAEQKGTARLRIFTPKVELPFAGHPALGAAVVLARPLQTDRLALETRIGTIPVRVEREGADPKAAYMTLPVPLVEPVENPQLLLDALGIENQVSPILRYSYGISHLVVELSSPEEVAALVPNLQALAYLGPVGIVVCARNQTNPDESDEAAHTMVRARVFVPGVGVAEDPATGSAAGPIALHLEPKGSEGLEHRVTISQGTELGRPSELRVYLRKEAGKVTQLEVGGDCAILGRGEWHIPGRSSDG